MIISRLVDVNVIQSYYIVCGMTSLFMFKTNAMFLPNTFDLLNLQT